MISRWQLGCFVSSPWPAPWSSWRWDITIINTIDRLDIVLIAFSSPYKTSILLTMWNPHCGYTILRWLHCHLPGPYSRIPELGDSNAIWYCIDIAYQQIYYMSSQVPQPTYLMAVGQQNITWLVAIHSDEMPLSLLLFLSYSFPQQYTITQICATITNIVTSTCMTFGNITAGNCL